MNLSVCQVSVLTGQCVIVRMSVGESQCVPSFRTYRTNCYSQYCSGWILVCAKFEDLQCYSQNVSGWISVCASFRTHRTKCYGQNVSGWISVCAKFQDSQDKVLQSKLQLVNLSVPGFRTYRTKCYGQNVSGWISVCAKFQVLIQSLFLVCQKSEHLSEQICDVHHLKVWAQLVPPLHCCIRSA